MSNALVDGTFAVVVGGIVVDTLAVVVGARSEVAAVVAPLAAVDGEVYAVD